MNRSIGPSEPSARDTAQPIAHFDATERRKEKMRRAAEEGKHPGPMSRTEQRTANGAAKPLQPHDREQSPIPINDAASELNAFLTELHQYMSESPSGALVRFPTLARVVSFLEGAQVIGQRANNPMKAEPGEPASATPLPAVPDESAARLEAPASGIESSGEAQSKRAVLEDVAALEAFMIDFVVEQTGYPREVVELDADLEADLGIDSIKKAQLFAELRDYFEINPNITRSDLTLDDFPTLRHVVNFIQTAATETANLAGPEITGGSNGVPPGAELGAMGPIKPETLMGADAAATDAFAEQEEPGSEPAEKSGTRRAVLEDPVALEAFMIDFVVEQTGYPREVVELDADLEADLGIDSIKKAQLFAELRDYFRINPNITRNDLTLDDFPTLRHVVNFIQTAAQEAHESERPAARTGKTDTEFSAREDRLQKDSFAATPGLEPLLDTLGRLMVAKGVVDAPVPRLTPETRLIDDLGFDSVMILKLATAVEKEFHIRLDLDELRLSVLNSAAAFAALLDRKLAAKH